MPIATLTCKKDTCDGTTCAVCKSAQCCGNCDETGKTKVGAPPPPPREKRTGKRCKKCGNAIKPKPTMQELGICTPDTCGTELVCGGDCCTACAGIPPKCDADTCGEKMDCFGKPLNQPEKGPEEPAADESLTMGEHVCRTDTCGNRLHDEKAATAAAEKKSSYCCNMCQKPITTKCDPTTCGESEEFTCEDCRGGCCGLSAAATAAGGGKCVTCGIVGGGNRSCGDCGGGPGGKIVGEVICGKSVCGKEVECVECGAGVVCKDETQCGSNGGGGGGGSGGGSVGGSGGHGCGKSSTNDENKPRCKKCLKKRLLAADCTKKTCPVCSGLPRADGRVPTCCKKCVRQESEEDLDKKVSASDIPPNIKRLVKYGWDVDDPLAKMCDYDDEDPAEEGAGGKEARKKSGGGKRAAGGGGAGDGAAATIDGYCVPGSSCRNRCGVCGDSCGGGGGNGNNNRNNNRGAGSGLKAAADPNLNVSSNCGAPTVGFTCTADKCGVTTRCHTCHGGREDKPEICPVCHPPEKACGPGVCQVLVDCGACCETPPDFKAAFPKIAYSGVGPFQLAVCGPIAGKIAAKKLGLDCRLPSPALEET